MAAVKNVILLGIVGSTAYGLAGPDSDVDRLGVYAAPTRSFLGLHPPLGKAASVVTTEPDVAFHEALKYATLAMSMNPTVTELMWLPDELYETKTLCGLQLLDIREKFLSARRTKDAYLGYATQQFQRLWNRTDGSFSADTRKRTAKHARHLLRLLHQGLALWETGRLEVQLADPQRYHDFGEAVVKDPEVAREALSLTEAAFNEIPTVLPDAPDEGAISDWLTGVRRFYLAQEEWNEPLSS
jgi:uncharacterized protein